MPSAPFHISPVRSPADLAATTDLMRAYAASLDVDLTYQNFEAELATLPGYYAAPMGALLLARDAGGTALGCVGLRPLDTPGCCEMKRLYVSPAGRGQSLGLCLAEAILAAATRLGYTEIRLDTLPSMAGAQAVYRKLGFEIIEPYYATPLPETLFMRLRLPSVKVP